METKSQCTSEDLFRVLDLMQANGIRVWVHGGWSLEAFTGFRKPHGDIDLFAHADDKERAAKALAPYVIKKASHKLKMVVDGVLVDLAFFKVLRSGIVTISIEQYLATWPPGSFGDDTAVLDGRTIPTASKQALYCLWTERQRNTPERMLVHAEYMKHFGKLLPDDEKAALARFFRENQTPLRRFLVFTGLAKDF
jgi:hypothetical protein